MKFHQEYLLRIVLYRFLYFFLWWLHLHNARKSAFLLREKISSKISGLSTNIFPVEEPKKSLMAATFFGLVFRTSSKLSLVSAHSKGIIWRKFLGKRFYIFLLKVFVLPHWERSWVVLINWSLRLQFRLLIRFLYPLCVLIPAHEMHLVVYHILE